MCDICVYFCSIVLLESQEYCNKELGCTCVILHKSLSLSGSKENVADRRAITKCITNSNFI